MSILKISIKVIYIALFSSFLIVGCSRKKDNFVSRNFHAVTTEFNTLYNGQNAFNEGIASITNDFSDNFWEILPVERLEITDDIVLSNEAQNSNFERAEEKATKAIQKHSMTIDGREKNPQIDEAYLLLGKARYFDQRFIPALAAFNQILYKYPASDKINTAKIWREKANIRLDNNELAIENLKRLLDQEELKPQDLADATSNLAQAYLNQKHIDSALIQIDIAATVTKNNIEKGRYRFIQGQLYNALGKKDSANYAFDKVIELNRKTSRIYLITAYLEKAKNFDYENGNKLEFLEHLTKLEENRENRPFLDKIYHQIASYHQTNESDTLAEIYYNKSLRTNSSDKLLVAKNYEFIGNMIFDRTQFKTAGAYYDSTLVNLKENSKVYRAIKKKRDNLDDVILYEDIAQRNDSILTIVNLPKAEQLSYFTTYTNNLREQAEALKEKEEIANRNNGTLGIIDSKNNLGLNPQGNSSTNSGEFYFYNQATVAFGKNDFVQKWGDRQLQDNWRFSNASGNVLNNDPNLNIDIANISDEERYDPQFYISRIPTKKTIIDSIARDRNFAYYQLGLIYKEKFKEYNLAKNRLQFLLKSNPEERLILPAKYNLYKVYELLNLQDEARIAKNDIINTHPESRYASILLNPNSALGEDENSPENNYKKLYTQFENQEYEEVIAQSDKFISLFDGEAIVPKFEFLKAVSRARIFGFETYKEAVNFIALNYPNSDEGKRAENMLKTVFPSMENKEFFPDNVAKNFKAIYQFKDTSSEEIDKFIKILNEAISTVKHFELTTSKDIYNNNTIFVVVHGFNSIQGASGFSDFLKVNQENREEKIDGFEELINKEYFELSSKNYEIIQIHKNLEDYLKLNSN